MKPSKGPVADVAIGGLLHCRVVGVGLRMGTASIQQQSTVSEWGQYPSLLAEFIQ